MRTEGMWTWIGRMVVLTRPWIVFVERTLGEYGELVVCEELARFLQKTYYRRLSAYGIWKNGIASRLSESVAGKKSKAKGYGRKRR